MAKAKKSKAKKSGAKKAPAKKKAKKVKKTAKRAAAKTRRAPARKSKKAAARKPAARKAKKAAPKKKQKLVGEGDYAASRSFFKDQGEFVKKNKAKIPQMGKQAERALDGPEGDSLRAAEQEAMNRSTID